MYIVRPARSILFNKTLTVHSLGKLCLSVLIFVLFADCFVLTEPLCEYYAYDTDVSFLFEILS